LRTILSGTILSRGMCSLVHDSLAVTSCVESTSNQYASSRCPFPYLRTVAQLQRRHHSALRNDGHGAGDALRSRDGRRHAWRSRRLQRTRRRVVSNAPWCHVLSGHVCRGSRRRGFGHCARAVSGPSRCERARADAPFAHVPSPSRSPSQGLIGVPGRIRPVKNPR
jgi:hypothetical protein